MKYLRFDTSIDDERVEKVIEVDPLGDAERSFETVRTGGPNYDLMPDGSVRYRSPVTDVQTERFGENGEVLIL